MNYASRLQQMVEAAGILQKDLALDLGVSEGTVSNLLNGNVRLTLADAERVLIAVQKRTGKTKGFTLVDLVREAA